MPRKAKTKTESKPKTYIAMILDKSGSMVSCLDSTIGAFNKEIHKTIRKTVKDAVGSDVLVSLVTFNQYVDFDYFNDNADKVRKLTHEGYVPDGSTSMYDAVGKTIDRLKKETDYKNKDNKYIVVTISDGEENASEEYTSADVAERVQELQKRGNWTFAYLGANQDLAKIAKTLNISKGNVANYGADKVSTRRAFAVTANAMNHMSSMSSADMAVSGSNMAFYSQNTGDNDMDNMIMQSSGIRDISAEAVDEEPIDPDTDVDLEDDKDDDKDKA